MRTTIFITLSHTLFVFDMPGAPFGRRPGHMNLYTAHWSDAVQVTGLEPVHVPAVHW